MNPNWPPRVLRLKLAGIISLDFRKLDIFYWKMNLSSLKKFKKLIFFLTPPSKVKALKMNF